MKYDIIIGMEIHTQLKTKSKMFCGCSNDGENQPPNTTICEVCTAQPGSLPVANNKAIEWTAAIGLALNCKIAQDFKFDRKNYFYPDIPKGYQISQYDFPICADGYLEVLGEKIGVLRIHLEEDTGKLLHPENFGYSLVDYNRAGTPLVELVTRPDIRDAATAKKFCQNYQQILRFLEVSGADMEKGQMRCEANVSLQKKGAWVNENSEIKPMPGKFLNPKIEIKNINSFRSLERAIEYEIKRQGRALSEGERLIQETRGWNEKAGSTYHQRTKESAHDYRYFPEPDLPVFNLSKERLAQIKADLPELPKQKYQRFTAEYELNFQDAEILSSEKKLAEFFEETISELRAWIITLQNAEGSEEEIWGKNKKKLAKMAANWLINKLGALLKIKNITFAEIKILPEDFAEFITLIYSSKINSTNAQKVLEIMLETGKDPSDILEEGDFLQDKEKNFDEIMEKVILENSDIVEKYKSGKITAIHFLVGQVMKESRGKANPEIVREILAEKLK